MLLKDAIIKFKQNLITMDKSEETIRSYLSDLTCFSQYLEHKYNCPAYLEEVQTADIEDYLYYLKEEKKLEGSSRSRNLYTLRSFWNYAYKKNLCERNVPMSVEPIKIQKKERTFLSAEEIEELIQHIHHDLVKVVIQTLFYTGMRINECLSLQLKDVDLENKMIHVINGKGKKDRNILMHQNLVTILQYYINHQRSEMKSTYFFATAKTGSLSAAYVNRILRETVESLGWTKHITAHILRHSFASNLIKNGVNLVHVQKLLGHSNLKITSIYTHANMEDLDKSINVL